MVRVVLVVLVEVVLFDVLNVRLGRQKGLCVRHIGAAFWQRGWVYIPQVFNSSIYTPALAGGAEVSFQGLIVFFIDGGRLKLA